MTSAIDVQQLIASITGAASRVVQEDVTALQGYSKQQVQMLAQQAAWIAQGSLSGQLTPELRSYFLANLENLAKDFAATIEGMVAITAEKVWNAVVGVLWDAIGKAIGVALPTPA